MADSKYFGVVPTNVKDVENRYPYVATAGQVNFPANYAVGYVDVYWNGSHLDPNIGAYTAADGQNVVLSTPASAGDSIYIVCRRQVQISANKEVFISPVTFNAGAGQTSFPLTYTPGSVFWVGRNGVGVPYTASDGNHVVLNTASNAGDVVLVLTHSPFSVANALSKSGDTASGPINLSAGGTSTTPAYGDATSNLATTLFTQSAIQTWTSSASNAGGSSDAITASFTPAITATTLAAGVTTLSIRAANANATATPTFTPNSGVVSAAVIVKGNNQPLVPGDISGAGHWITLQWDSTLSKWVLLNPATGITSIMPTGTPLWWLTPVCPTWALVRDGSAISRAAYPKLFAALCPTRSGTTATGTNVVSGLSTTTDLYVGMPVEGDGIPAWTTVSGITSGTSVKLSANATASATVPITLFYYGYGSGGSAATFGLPDDRGLFERGLDTGARGYEATVINGTTTSGNNAITGISSTKGLFFGQAVWGAGIPAGATISGITSASAITISSNATASGTVAITFTGGQIGNERNDDLKAHMHGMGVENVGSGTGTVGDAWGQGSAGNYPSGVGTGYTGGSETRPRFRSYLPIIVY